jgi:hypothetical protein
MTESDLDGLYGELCRVLTEVGETRALLLLARFALLAIGEIDDVERARALLVSARDFELQGVSASAANGVQAS